MSQGGGLAFATAALDQRIDLCIADIPWLCDWVNYSTLVDTDDGMDRWMEAKKSRTEESVLKTLSYFDTMNLADRIQCPPWGGCWRHGRSILGRVRRPGRGQALLECGGQAVL